MSVGIAQLPNLAFKNRRLVEQSQIAGCFHCGKTFSPQDVKQYTDNEQTSICPLCGVDAVLGDMAGFAITEQSLQHAKYYWFKKN